MAGGDESLLRTAALAPAPKPLAASASAATALEAMVAAAEVDPEAAAVATETVSASAATLRLDAGAASPGQVTAPSSYINCMLSLPTPHSSTLTLTSLRLQPDSKACCYPLACAICAY